MSRDERDAQMYALWRAGKSFRQIGRKFGVTHTAACVGVRRHLNKLEAQ